MALSDNPIVIEALNDLLSIVAGDHFEGWADFWMDEEKVYERVMTILEAWETDCAESAAAPAHEKEG